MKQTQKYKKAKEILPNEPHNRHNDLYLILESMGYTWNIDSKEWEICKEKMVIDENDEEGFRTYATATEMSVFQTFKIPPTPLSKGGLRKS